MAQGDGTDGLQALLDSKPILVQASVEAYIDMVKTQFCIPAFTMYTTVTRIAGIDSRTTKIATFIGTTLTPSLSQLDADEKELKTALVDYLGVVRSADDGPAEPGTGSFDTAFDLFEAIQKYIEEFGRALKAAVEAGAAFVSWARGQARNYYRTDEAFAREHPDIKSAMICSGMLLIAVEAVIGQLALLQPYLLVLPTTLEIGKKIGDTLTVETVAWLDSRSEENVQRAWPHVVAGEGRSVGQSAWELLTGRDNASLGAGAVNDAGTIAGLVRPVAEPVASVLGSGQSGVGIFFQVFSLGMAVSELEALDWVRQSSDEQDEPSLSDNQWREVELLKKCCTIAFQEKDRSKLYLFATGGQFRIMDTENDRTVLVGRDGSPVETSKGSARYGLEFAKIRYEADGFRFGSGTYLADWEAAEPKAAADRSAGHPFAVFLVEKDTEVGHDGTVYLDDDGQVLDADIAAEAAAGRGFGEALEYAKANYDAVLFPAPGSAQTSKSGAIATHAGLKFDWSQQKYRSGALFLDRFRVAVRTHDGGECLLTIDSAGNSSGPATLGGLEGAAATVGTFDSIAYDARGDMDAVRAGHALAEKERAREALRQADRLSQEEIAEKMQREAALELQRKGERNAGWAREAKAREKRRQEQQGAELLKSVSGTGAVAKVLPAEAVRLVGKLRNTFK